MRAKWRFITLAGNARDLAKRKKTQVTGIVEDRLKPSTLLSCLLATAVSGMILYNLFLGQNSREVPPGTTTKVSVAQPGKSSQTVTIRYDELVEDVQRQLLALGHFQGMVDGVNGPMTRDAVIRYQRDKQLDESGEVSRQLLEHILYTVKLSQAAEFTGSVAPAADESPKPMVLKKPVPVQVEVEKQSPAQGDPKVLSVQKRLARLGFDPGVRSGKIDGATKSAILTFEMENGLAMQGALSKPFLAALKQAETRAGLLD